MALPRILSAGNIAEDCDVLARHCDTARPQIEAEKAGVWGIGYNSDMSAAAPGAVLCSVVWHWGACCTALVQSVIDGTFAAAPCFGGLAEGVVDITALAAGIAAEGTAERIAAEREGLITGAFNVFDGVLNTHDGRMVGNAGETLPDAEIQRGVNWYYHTVIEM
jgi:basic membrane protein A